MALTRHIWAGFNKNWQKHKHLSIVFIQSHAVTQCHRTQHNTWMTTKDAREIRTHTHSHSHPQEVTKESNCYTFFLVFFTSSYYYSPVFFSYIVVAFSPFDGGLTEPREHKQPKYWWAKWCTRNASKWQLHSTPPNTNRKKIRAGSIFNLMRTCLFVIHLPTVRYVQLEIVYYKWVDLPSVVSLTETISAWMKINAS